MDRKHLPHLAVVGLVLVLLIAVLLIRRLSQGPDRGFTGPVAVLQPQPPPGPVSPAPSPVAKTAEEIADPNEVVDPAKILRAELLVRVLSTDGTPIPGAKIFPTLSTNAFDGEEGIHSDHLIGGGSWTSIRGKNAIFRGMMSTNSEGMSLLQVFLPRRDRYLNGHIGVSVEAPLTVRRKDHGQLRLPKEGERKEITFRLAPGQIIHGKILNLEGDDVERLFVQFLLPGEEKKERKDWTNLADVKPDGTFESDPAPLAPLVLRIEHRRRKYLPYNQRLDPPVQGIQQIVLQRDSSFKQQGRAVFTFTNPPAGGKFDHQLRVYSENSKGTVGGTSNSSDVSPQKMDLVEGSYQVFVASLDQDQPLWARASFTVTDTGTTEVPLTLQPSCTVRFRVREKATGKPPGVDDLFLHCDVMIGDKPVDFIGKKMGYGKTKTATPGEYVFTTVPAGTIRLRVEGMRGPYQDAVQIVTVTPEQETSVEILLEAAPKDE